MKEIIVNEKNRGIIENIIKEKEGKARERKITYSDIVKACDTIEKTLDIPKKHLNGVSYFVDIHAEKLPNAYKYTPYSTQFVVLYNGGKWRLTWIERTYLNQRKTAFEIDTLPEEAKKAILDKYKNF